MNTRQTWWLVSVALVLAAYIVIFERGEAGGGKGTNFLNLLENLQPRDVLVMEIEQPDQPLIRLRRSPVNALWSMEAPLHYPARTAAADRWLDLLRQAKWVVRLTPDDLKSQGAKPSDFGLEPPQLTVRVRQSNRTNVVHLGNRLAVGKQFYLKLNDQPEIYLADSQLLEAIPQGVTDWRDPGVLTFASIVTSNTFNFDYRITVKSPNGFTLQPSEDGSWRLLSPISARADRLKIAAGLINPIALWQVEEFVTDDPSTNLAAFGLQSPMFELAIGRGTNDLLAVQFGGSPADRPDLIYARLLRHTNIVLTARTNIDLFRLPARFWRDQLLVHLATNRVQEIVGSLGGTNSTYRIRQQTNGTWQVVEPELLPADAELIQEFFQGMNGINVDIEKDVVTDYAAYGLDEPPRQFSFLSYTNGVATNFYPVVSFGTNATSQVFARRSDETVVYSVHSNLFTHLPLSHWQWRDRAIWSFGTNDVLRVRITDGDKSREVLRNPEGRWELGQGSSGVLDLRLDEAILQLGMLSVDRWMWVGAGQLGRPVFGFDSNKVHRVSIEVSQKGMLRTNVVEFGGLNSEGKPYAAVQFGDERTWFFEFPPVLYYELVKPCLTIPDAR